MPWWKENGDGGVLERERSGEEILTGVNFKLDPPDFERPRVTGQL